MSKTEIMNGKPVAYVPAKSVLNLESGFRHKLLCDGPTFTAGTACSFGCTYCYVPDMMRKSPHLVGIEVKHHEIVIRREGAVEALRKQLMFANGKLRFNDPNDHRVCYASPLVDVAGNAELADETVAACKEILCFTNWHIRLLSKSVLIKTVAERLADSRDRFIFGVSTGTLDDNLSRSFEVGTSAVSARLKTLHWLQDNGFRTYGMICPSLPQRDYTAFARDMAQAIRADRCEHVWAECMNARGESFTRTFDALETAGYAWEAKRLREISNDSRDWENYSRATFEAHVPFYRPGQLRFLQYVTKDTKAWWQAREEQGAILL